MSAYNVRPPVLVPVPLSAERFALFRGEPITIAGYGVGAGFEGPQRDGVADFRVTPRIAQGVGDPVRIPFQGGGELFDSERLAGMHECREHGD
ncbi:hypothetical protein SNOUR_03885 [Streptomyces noursei ATCC 11455]|uniref:hypothetical protein n=1 Tax=Streptomyces noursei TaxID=1971 RepID=UPI00081CA79C|nr:hypothetical protein SNOUR_03885 [Streptomyces noursei ATCC 11455]